MCVWEHALCAWVGACTVCMRARTHRARAPTTHCAGRSTSAVSGPYCQADALCPFISTPLPLCPPASQPLPTAPVLRPRSSVRATTMLTGLLTCERAHARRQRQAAPEQLLLSFAMFQHHPDITIHTRHVGSRLRRSPPSSVTASPACTRTHPLTPHVRLHASACDRARARERERVRAGSGQSPSTSTHISGSLETRPFTTTLRFLMADHAMEREHSPSFDNARCSWTRRLRARAASGLQALRQQARSARTHAPRGDTAAAAAARGTAPDRHDRRQ